MFDNLMKFRYGLKTFLIDFDNFEKYLRETLKTVEKNVQEIFVIINKVRAV